jgi:predicted ester cyclase
MSGAAAMSETERPNPDAATLIRRWFDEVWNQGREEAIDELLSKDATMWGIGRPGESSKGSSEFKKFHKTMLSALSGTKITLDHVVQEGDTAFARWTVTAKHTGGGLATEATQKQLKISGMSACRVREGIIVEAWNVWDQIGMARQLGILEGKATSLFP